MTAFCPLLWETYALTERLVSWKQQKMGRFTDFVESWDTEMQICQKLKKLIFHFWQSYDIANTMLLADLKRKPDGISESFTFWEPRWMAEIWWRKIELTKMSFLAEGSKSLYFENSRLETFRKKSQSQLLRYSLNTSPTTNRCKIQWNHGAETGLYPSGNPLNNVWPPRKSVKYYSQ